MLLAMLLANGTAMALSLPNPPDPSAPANNVNGPLPYPNKQSFAPDILLVKDSSVVDTRPMNAFVANFYCTGGTKTITKKFSTEIGESISGPLTNDETQGIISAINSVKPPKTVDLTVAVSGDPSKNTTYTLTGVSYLTTTYSIWVITQTGPPAQEQRVGFIVTAVPQQPPEINATAEPCPADHSTPTVEYGTGFKDDPNAWLTQPIIQLLTPPDDGAPPFFQYGIVMVMSGGSVYGVTHVLPGENATFLLPPGTYTVSADVVLLGIPFSVSGGSVTSPPGAIAILLTVTITTVEEIWYGLVALAIIIVIIVIWVIVRHFRGGGDEPETTGEPGTTESSVTPQAPGGAEPDSPSPADGAEGAAED